MRGRDLDDLPLHGNPLESVVASPLEYPKSRYLNYVSPLPPVHEVTALQDLKDEWTQAHKDHETRHTAELMIIDLDWFSIYRPPGHRLEYELTPLHLLNSAIGVNELFFDGILSTGNTRRYVEAEPFSKLSIEGYDDGSEVTSIYIKSLAAGNDQTHDIWYRLRTPSAEYKIYYEPFTWVATFAIHFVGYLESHPKVHLHHFREDFYDWATDRHKGDIGFNEWMKLYGRTDFRHAVNAYVQFLYNETANVNDRLIFQPVWDDCFYQGSAIQQQKIISSKTIVTPFVYGCFIAMYFAECLEVVWPSKAAKHARLHRMKEMGFAINSRPHSEPKSSTAQTLPPTIGKRMDFQVGDVVGVQPDHASKWKGSGDLWIAYVQKIKQTRNSEQRLCLIWLYRPEDTTISTAKYPIPNELFLSDNCNCGSTLKSSEVIRKFEVDWRPRDLNTDKDFLVRQKYVTGDDNAFVTLQDSDFSCRCGPKNEPEAETIRTAYRPGDCVYIQKNNNLSDNVGEKGEGNGQAKEGNFLEPAVIVGFEENNIKIIVRHLGRRINEPSNGAKVFPNELFWTEELYTVYQSQIVRRCNVRFYSAEDALAGRIPTPYDRGGTGDCWFISTRLVSKGKARTLVKLRAPFPKPLNEGFDPTDTSLCKPLRGLSMFSGGGNLDRGLEEGGAVKFTNVVDISGPAVHTQLANSENHGKMQIFLGSVDDYNKALATGQRLRTVANIGEIEFIAAGSPCPGFSALQRDWKSVQSKKNASHITSFCSAVDTYRPLYAILENVVTMAWIRDGKENVFSQLIACLVGMGYQVQQHLGDAWSHGSFQQRSRLFIAITAPGLIPMSGPRLTHAHPPDVGARSIGMLPNGERFGCREDCVTPFRMVTAKEGIKKLPDVGSSSVQMCIPFPDHRNLSRLNSKDRALIRNIPTYPDEQNYFTACQKGLVPKSLMKSKKIPGKSFQRLNPQKLVPTITTSASPQDCRIGNTLHWSQHRVFTIQEARRAQGIPDNEVIIGTPTEQWRIIGNAVDRSMALSLGLSLRWAHLANENNRLDVSTSSILTESAISVRRERTVQKTGHSETTLDRLSVISETTVWRTRTVSSGARVSTYIRTHPPTRSPNKPESRVPVPEREPTNKRQVELIQIPSDEEDAEPAKRTRYSGIVVDHGTKDWSERIEASVQRRR